MNRDVDAKSMMLMETLVKDGYHALHIVLTRALEQAQFGKGHERHATDKPFVDQPILTIGRMVGPGYQLGQAMKKAQESTRLPTIERQVAELLGAINYLAAAVILLEEEDRKCQPL